MELARTSWNSADYIEFINYLQSLSDEKYKEFNSRIIPDTPHFFGIRIPALRDIAKKISKGNADEFLSLEKGDFHEEIIIDGLVRAGRKSSYEQMKEDMVIFSQRIYNWAICDTVSFKGIKKYIPEFWADKDIFIKSGNPWQVRFGLGVLMNFYLTDEYIDEVLKITENVKSDFYYVNMMQAWLIATAAAKQRDKTIEFLKKSSLDDTVFKMTVRKVTDSYRISKEDKILIKGIR